MRVRVTVNDAHAQAVLNKIKRATETGLPRIMQRVAYWTYGQLVRNTPKRWTGQTRKSWQIMSSGRGYIVTNLSKVMVFLEGGTRAHGPKTAKALFIPLTRKAAMGTGGKLVYGRDYVLAKWVKGIRPRNIVADQRTATQDRLYQEMRAYLTNVLGS